MIVLASVFAIFVPALLLPGPDFVAVVRSSMTRGTRAGLLTTLGVSAGLGLYAALSLLGLSAVLTEYQWLTWVVRVLGGGYLIYLGIKLWRTTPASLHAQPIEAGSRTKTFLSGLLLTSGNPKVILFYLGLLPTFVDLTRLSIADMGMLTAMFLIILGSTLTAYAYAAARARRLFSSKTAMRRLNRSAGVVLIGSGGAVAAS